MNRKSIFILLFSIVLFVIGCSNNNVNDVNSNSNTPIEDVQENEGEIVQLTISAAVSLTDALEEIQGLYEQENNVELTFNLAGSGTLAQQIQQGAPVDLFISANQNWMDTLEEEDILLDETRTDITGNKLVLIAGESSDLSYQSFEEISAKDVTQIAIGNPESVPAGQYAEDVLRNLDKWDELEDQMVLAKDVRQVLTYVETGNTDIGFVYESDAMSSDKIKVLATADPDLSDPIIYPASVLADTEHEQAAKDFLDYLGTAEAQDILAKHGFTK